MKDIQFRVPKFWKLLKSESAVTREGDRYFVPASNRWADIPWDWLGKSVHTFVAVIRKEES